MSETINLEMLVAMFESVAAEMQARAEELCAMDAKMGDGDLGLTMKKGFGAMPELLQQIEEADIGKRLMKAGMKMASVVPSTMGTLMASGIMNGGKLIAGRTELDAASFAAFLQGFAEGIAKRGKCTRGQRTVLDAIGPAADAAAKAVEENPEITLAELAAVVLQAAEAGVRATADMAPVFGKAAVHQAAAVGVPDQGACAAMYMLRGMQQYLSAAK